MDYVPWNTLKTTINKWTKYGTTVTLLRTGCLDEITKRNLVREAAKKPTATLKELQQFLESTGCSLNVTAISQMLHIFGFRGRVEIWKSVFFNQK